MELLSRAKNDRYTRPGHYQELEKCLRSNPDTAKIPILVCYAFDYRTRLGPFLFAIRMQWWAARQSAVTSVPRSHRTLLIALFDDDPDEPLGITKQYLPFPYHIHAQ